jgi:uncharacterized SAM-binding protein YcdF (DUF218 family)
MFYLSKIFWLAAQPLSLAFIAIVLGCIAGFSGWRRLGGGFATLAGLILFVTLYTSAGAVALQTLEDRFSRPRTEPDNLGCMIVLGGAFETEVTTRRGGIELNQAGDRFVEALRLLRAHPQSRVLVSGGDGSLSGAYEGDAAASARFFSIFGIAPERLVGEATSRTTYENVVNTKDILVREKLQGCLLITSAFHMPRAVGLFRKAGIDMTPWPTDYRTAGNVRLMPDFSQPTANAQLTATALREWIGLLGYFLSGRTSALYPG